MKVNARNIIGVVLIINLIAATGFLREFLFVNINEQIRFLIYGNEPSQMSTTLSFLSSWSFNAIYTLKWVLTAVFSLIYLLEAELALQFLFRRTFRRELIFVYALLILSAAMFFTGFWVFGNVHEGYTLARFLMGLAQSPVPLMLLIPATFLRNRGMVQSS